MQWKCIGVCLLLMLLDFSTGIIVKVEPQSEQCFYEYVETGKTIEVSYGVIEGGQLDIEVKFFFGKQMLFSKLYFEGKEEGKLKFNCGSGGIYGVCFNNMMSRFTPKTIDFEYSVMVDLDHATPDDINPLKQSLGRIENNINFIKQEQQYYRNRERRHRNTAESTNTRVYTWSLIQSIILVLMTIAQVVFLKNMINK